MEHIPEGPFLNPDSWILVSGLWRRMIVASGIASRSCPETIVTRTRENGDCKSLTV